MSETENSHDKKELYLLSQDGVIIKYTDIERNVELFSFFSSGGDFIIQFNDKRWSDDDGYYFEVYPYIKNNRASIEAYRDEVISLFRYKANAFGYTLCETTGNLI